MSVKEEFAVRLSQSPTAVTNVKLGLAALPVTAVPPEAVKYRYVP